MGRTRTGRTLAPEATSRAGPGDGLLLRPGHRLPDQDGCTATVDEMLCGCRGPRRGRALEPGRAAAGAMPAGSRHHGAGGALRGNASREHAARARGAPDRGCLSSLALAQDQGASRAGPVSHGASRPAPARDLPPLPPVSPGSIPPLSHDRGGGPGTRTIAVLPLPPLPRPRRAEPLSVLASRADEPRARPPACVGWSSQAACYESGFTDPAHFSRLFKQIHGLSPRELAARTLRTARTKGD